MSVEHTKAMPVADGMPVLGSALNMLRNPLAFLRQQAEKKGPIFRMKAVHREMIVMSGKDAVKFMNEEGKDCFISSDFWGQLTRYWQCPHFLSALDGKEHIDMRRAFKSSMVRGAAIERQRELIKIIDETVSRYTAHTDVVSARALTRTLTNSELYLLMTHSWPNLSSEIANSIAEYQRITFNVLVLGKWPRVMLYTPWYQKHKRRSFEFVRQLQLEFEKTPPESGFFKAVIELRKNVPDFSEGDYNFLFLAPFWAGLDTLGAGLTFLIRELVENTSVRERLKRELEMAVDRHGDIPDAEALRKLPELYGFCMEILRLYPVAFANGRSAARDFEFNGYKVKKGENLLIFTTSTHFDSRLFPNPDCLDTQRAQAGENPYRSRYVFNPFGRGPHICLGAGMAESMLLTTAAVLIHKYDIVADKPGKHYEMIFDPSPTLSANFKVRITPKYSVESV